MRTVTLSGSNQTTQLLDCSNGNLVVTLPDATANSGKTFLFKRVDSTLNTAKIVGYGSQVVANNRNVCTLYNKGNSFWIQSSGGTTWRTLDKASGAKLSFAALPPKKDRGCTDWGTHNMLVQGSDGNIYGWGLATNRNLAGNVAAGTEILRPVVFDPNDPPANTAYIVDWAANGNNLFVVFSDGTVFGAGENNYGQLGISSTTDSAYLKRIPFFNSTPAVKVWSFSAGGAVTGIGKTFFQTNLGKVYACGYNAQGALGVGGTTSPITSPTLVSGIYNPCEIKSAHAYSGSYTTICDAAGSLYVSGYNAQGQLGTGSTTQLTSFSKIISIAGAKFVHAYPYGGNNASTNAAFNAALDHNGILYMAGLNTAGQLGQGNTTATNNTWYKLCSNAAYNTGTVSNSKSSVVTGVGTAWTSIDSVPSSLQIGFGNSSPSEISTWYQITDINSNTSIDATGVPDFTQSTPYCIKAIPPPNPIVDFVWTGNGVTLSCMALDNTGKFLTWGYNNLNNLFYDSTTTPRTAPTINSRGFNAKLVCGSNSPAAVTVRNLLFWDGSKLRVSGTNLAGFVAVSDSDPSYSTGSSVIALPDSIYSGTETITDMFVNNDGGFTRLFILTDFGNLYASGDNTNGVCTGGNSAATDVGLFKLEF